jgi:uncharacterized protein YabE (DUF348 family)
VKINRKRLVILSFILLAILLIAGGVALYKSITIVIDGKERSINTFALTVGAGLQSAGVSIYTGDLITPNLTAWLADHSTITIQRAVYITILADEQVHTFQTTARLPRLILAQAGILIQPSDMLLEAGTPISPDEPLAHPGERQNLPQLEIIRALEINLDDNGDLRVLTTSKHTVGEALFEAGIELGEADVVAPALDTRLAKGLQIEIQRARKISILSGEQVLEILTTAKKVGAVLAESGLTLQGLDYSQPSEDEPLTAGDNIRVVRVSEEVLIEQTPIPFENQYQAVAELEIDSQQILQNGEYGIQAERVRVRYEDGVEVSRTVEGEWTARQPVVRIIGYGTNLVQHTVDTPDGTITYWRAIPMLALSYHPSELGGSTTTASGEQLRKGIVAVDTRYIPFYTRLYIPGYGEGLAADTGGDIKGRVIDLGYLDDEYVSWHKNVTVYFLWPPPDNIVWIFP